MGGLAVPEEVVCREMALADSANGVVADGDGE